VPEFPEVEAWRRQLDPDVKRYPIAQAGPAHIATLKTFDPPLSTLTGRRLGDELPEFAHGLLVGGFGGVAGGLAVPAGDEDDLARATIGQHHSTPEAWGLWQNSRHEGLQGGGEFVELIGRDPGGVHAGVHVLLLWAGTFWPGRRVLPRCRGRQAVDATVGGGGAVDHTRRPTQSFTCLAVLARFWHGAACPGVLGSVRIVPVPGRRPAGDAGGGTVGR